MWKQGWIVQWIESDIERSGVGAQSFRCADSLRVKRDDLYGPACGQTLDHGQLHQRARLSRAMRTHQHGDTPLTRIQQGGSGDLKSGFELDAVARPALDFRLAEGESGTHP